MREIILLHKSDVKVLVEAAFTFTEADLVMRTYSGCLTEIDKIEYLREIFEIEDFEIHRENVHADYVSLLTSIIETAHNPYKA